MKKNKIILGVNSLLSGPHHDNGAFLFYGDRYVGISSERLDREKYSCGYRVKLSEQGVRVLYEYDRAEACIQYCLDTFGLTIADVDLLVYLEGIPEYVDQKYPSIPKIGTYDHHLMHAYSTFYSSGFEDAAILIVDGQGKRIENQKDIMVVQSIFSGKKNTGITLLKETSWDKNNRMGIGTLYEMVTKLLGFSSEGTTMGLSSYSHREDALGFDFLKRYSGGHIYANDFLLSGLEGKNLKFLQRDMFLKQLSLSEEQLELGKIPYGFATDIASQIQSETEDGMLELAKEAFLLTGSKNLCIAGGVGLNSVANTKVLQKSGFENIFIHPSTDDSGLAYGAALYGRKKLYGNEEEYRIKNFYFGKTYAPALYLQTLEKYTDFLHFKKVVNLSQETAEILMEGKIIGFFQDGSETGPRALGNRSILADPRSVEVRDRVNRIKKREWWRPLAPAVLEEYAEQFFHIPKGSESYQYMLLVVDVLEHVWNVIPGVVHVDHTARIQIVSYEQNSLFYSVIDAFRKISGLPVVMNTSLNSAGEPIVETPEDAIKMFLSSELDYLVLGEYLVSKEMLYPKFGFQKSLLLQERLFQSWKKEISLYEHFIHNFDR